VYIGTIRTRREFLVFGVASAVVGFVVLFGALVFALLIGGGFGIGFGAIGVGSGALLIARGRTLLRQAQSMPRIVGRTATAPDDDDPRWDRNAEEATAPQVIGKKCVECAAKLIFATEGTVCGECDEVCHHKCVARHRATAHAQLPYRA